MNMKAEDRLELATLKVKQFLVGKSQWQVIDVLEPWRRAQVNELPKFSHSLMVHLPSKMTAHAS